MATLYSPRVVTDDLRVYLDAGNSKSYPGTGTVFYDLTERKNNWTLANATYDQRGYFSFNGTTSQLTRTVSFSGWTSDSSPSTVMMWFRPTATPTSASTATLFSDNCFEYGLRYTNTNQVLYGSYGTYTGANSHVGINEWACASLTSLTSTPNGGGTTHFSCYLNGSPISLNRSATTINGTYDIPFGIGRDPCYADQWFTGDIAIAMLYQRQLTSDEIMRNYNATKRRFGL